MFKPCFELYLTILETIAVRIPLYLKLVKDTYTEIKH